MKCIDQLSLTGKKVFIRADLNVPLRDDKSVADETRIRAALDTVSYAIKEGAKVIVCSHLGRPDGKRDLDYSLAPVAKVMSQILSIPVKLAPDCIGAQVTALANALQNGEVLLLENLRFHSEEEANDSEFAQALGSLAEVYINDAFATAHRAHASTAGITKFVSEKAGGFTMTRELDYFTKAFRQPTRPLAVIFGGAKVSTKMAAIRNVVKNADCVVIGGAMANTFFAAKGAAVGKSLHEPSEFDAVLEIEKTAKANNCTIVLPTDVVVAKEMKTGVATRITSINDIASDESAFDIGPNTVATIKKTLENAKTIVWNGPMGAFEIPEFSAGTYAIVDLLIESPARTVVGGGDTDRALHERHALEKMDYVSTAGGAFLKLLEGKELPAVKALEE